MKIANARIFQEYLPHKRHSLELHLSCSFQEMQFVVTYLSPPNNVPCKYPNPNTRYFLQFCLAPHFLWSLAPRFHEVPFQVAWSGDGGAELGHCHQAVLCGFHRRWLGGELIVCWAAPLLLRSATLRPFLCARRHFHLLLLKCHARACTCCSVVISSPGRFVAIFPSPGDEVAGFLA